MTTAFAPIDNGVDVAVLTGAKEALAGNAEMGALVWRADATWVTGAHTSTTFDTYWALGGEQRHIRRHVVETDHTELFAATDDGATPPETALAALAGCLTAGIATIAQHRGIQLRSVKAMVEGDMDVRGILGADRDVRNGFSAIRVSYRIDADASPEDIDAVVAQSQKRSAVFDLIANPTPVTIEVAG